MTHKEFRELQGKADAIGLITDIRQIGRGNYRLKRKGPTGETIIVKRSTHYRRKYQVVINGQNVGKPYCRRISAKLLIIQQYQARLKELQNRK